MAKKSSKNTILIIIIILAVLSCCCVTTVGAIGGYYYYKQRESDHDTDNSQDKYTDQDDDNSDDISELIYTNDEYNFSIELTEGWEDYIVEEDEGSYFDDYVAIFAFILTSSTEGEITIFTIDIYTHDQWEPYEDYYEIWGNTYILGTDDDYVYTFSHMNNILPDDLSKKQILYNLDNIRNSFEFL